MLFCPKPPPNRLTITLHVIKSSSKFLLASSQGKGLILVKAFEKQNDIASLPVRLVIDSTWWLGLDATDQLNAVLKK